MAVVHVCTCVYQMISFDLWFQVSYCQPLPPLKLHACRSRWADTGARKLFHPPPMANEMVSARIAPEAFGIGHIWAVLFSRVIGPLTHHHVARWSDESLSQVPDSRCPPLHLLTGTKDLCISAVSSRTLTSLWLPHLVHRRPFSWGYTSASRIWKGLSDLRFVYLLTALRCSSLEASPTHCPRSLGLDPLHVDTLKSELKFTLSLWLDDFNCWPLPDWS